MIAKIHQMFALVLVIGFDISLLMMRTMHGADQ